MDAYELETTSWRKLLMWYKVNELSADGLKIAQICRETGLDKKTVRRYLSMTHDEFVASATFKRMYVKLLDPYELKVKEWLSLHTDLSSAQIHDWLRERYSNLPDVSAKTVFNFVKYIRAKYAIEKPPLSTPRAYAKLEETDFGEYAQADFGEMSMSREDGRKLKVYFFVMVLCRSRKKYVYLSTSPFTAEKTIYAHEKAFEYYGGKPKQIIYDMDSVLIHKENMGDYLMTKAFNAFVNKEHFKPIFCHKSDPESKGKVENVVKYVKYNFLRGRTFHDIDRLNEEAINWLSRTANGLPHSTTKLIPDEVFKEEQGYLLPYTGTPSIPGKAMREYTVQKHNIISFMGNTYSLPLGSYIGPKTKVWVNMAENILEIYNHDTGKLITTHVIPEGKGHYEVKPEHRQQHYIQKDKLKNEILEYSNYDSLAAEWMINLQKDKPRYYGQNLRYLVKHMRHYEPATLHKVFEKCLEKGMYNAKDFIALCDRTGKKKPIQENGSMEDNLPSAAKEVPDSTDISNFEKIFAK